MALKEDHKSTSLIKELQLQNEEKEKRIAELVLANKELQIQNEKKDKLAAKLLIANKELSYLIEKKDGKDQEFILPADKLQNNKHQFQLMVESIKDYAIFMLDPEGRVASWNSGAENIKGYTAAEIIGQPMDVFYTTEQLQIGEPLKNLQQALQDGKFETQGWRVRKDGTLFWADIVFTTLYDKDHKFYGYAKVTRDTTEKRKADEQMLFLASIASNIEDPIISTDNDGFITRWNKAGELLLGWNENEVIGKRGAEILKVDYLGTTRESILESLKQKSYWHGEVVYHAKSGRPVNVLITASQLKDREGNVTGNLALVRDITERKITEAKIKQSEILYSTLFYESPGMKAISDAATGKYLDVNHSFARFLERAKNDIVGKTSLDLNMISQAEEREKSMKQMKEFGFVRDMEMSILSASGKKYWVSINADLIILEGQKCFLSDAVDITKRKEAEDDLSKLTGELEQKVMERTAEIEKNEKMFRALIENNRDIISLTDDALNTVYRSPSTERFTGWTPEDLTVKSSVSYYHPDDIIIFKTAVSEAIKKPGKPQPYISRFLHKNGHYIWLEGTATKLPAESIIQGLVFNSRDITERIKLEHLLNKANALARIGGWEIDLIKGTVYWSDITREIHETDNDYVTDLATGISFYKEGPGRDLITQKVKEAIELGKPWDVELQIITAKNNERWVRSIGETEFANGQCIRVYGSFQDIDDRKKGETEREELSERLQLATQSAQLGLWDWDVKKNKLIWDQEMYRLYNLTENEFTSVYEGWSSRLHPEDRQQVEDEMQLALAGKKEYKPAFRIVWPDLSVHYINASGIIERDDDGNAIRMTGFNWDVTEQKKAEQAILASEEKFRQTFERISDGFVAVDKNWYYTYMNKKAGEITHQDPKLVIGKNLWKQYPDLIGSPFYNAYHLAIEEQKYVYLEEYYPVYDRWFENHIYPSPDGLSVYFTDITERKRANEKIKESEIRYRTIIEQATDAICIADSSQKIIDINPYACELFGYTKEEATQLSVSHLLFKEDIINNPLELAELKAGVVVRSEQRLKSKDGTAVEMAVSTKLMEDGRLILFGHNITERKLSEDRLNRLNQQLMEQSTQLLASNKELEQFAFVASHDLQEPLRMITSYLSLLEKRYGGMFDEKSKKYIDFAVDGARRMRAVIQDVLEFSRVGKNEGYKENVDLNKLIQEIKLLLAKQMEEKPVSIYCQNLPIIYAQKTALLLVFQNLLSNAIKYAVEGKPAEIDISATSVSDYWQFAVKDNGIGIDPQFFDKIFIIFQRLHNREHYSGTGIGLAITKKIIENRGGKIWVESEEGKGSTFYFTVKK